jgi:hypothetical protein
MIARILPPYQGRSTLARGSENIATVPADVLSEVRAKLEPLLLM